MSRQSLETAAQIYAERRDLLAGTIEVLNDELDRIRRRVTPGIRAAQARAAQARQELEEEIRANGDLFAKPRTQVIAGVKVGFRKQKGKVEIPDEEKTIRLIRQNLPEEQADLLIRVRETVDKNVCYDLEVGWAKKLGIRVSDDGDEVVIKSIEAEIDKLIEKSLGELEAQDQEEANVRTGT